MTHIFPDIFFTILFPIARLNDQLSRTSQIFPLGILRVKSKCHSPPKKGNDTPPMERQGTGFSQFQESGQS